MLWCFENSKLQTGGVFVVFELLREDLHLNWVSELTGIAQLRWIVPFPEYLGLPLHYLCRGAQGTCASAWVITWCDETSFLLSGFCTTKWVPATRLLIFITLGVWWLPMFMTLSEIWIPLWCCPVALKQALLWFSCCIHINADKLMSRKRTR